MKNKTYVYVSGPMTGIKNNNAPAFNAAARALRRLGYKVVNPAEYDSALGKGMSWTDCLRRDLALICNKCSVMALLPGWERSKGANLEVYVAEKLGMAIYPISEFVDLKGGR